MTGGHDPHGGEKTGWMEHGKPEWILVDLLGGHCSCLGKGLGGFNLGDKGWRWHKVREFRKCLRGKMHRTWRWVGCGGKEDSKLRLPEFWLPLFNIWWKHSSSGYPKVYQ